MLLVERVSKRSRMYFHNFTISVFMRSKLIWSLSKPLQNARLLLIDTDPVASGPIGDQVRVERSRSAPPREQHYDADSRLSERELRHCGRAIQWAGRSLRQDPGHQEHAQLAGVSMDQFNACIFPGSLRTTFLMRGLRPAHSSGITHACTWSSETNSRWSRSKRTVVSQCPLGLATSPVFKSLPSTVWMVA